MHWAFVGIGQAGQSSLEYDFVGEPVSTLPAACQGGRPVPLHDLIGNAGKFPQHQAASIGFAAEALLCGSPGGM